MAIAWPPTLSCGAVPGAYVGARPEGWSSVAPGPLPGHLAVQTGLSVVDGLSKPAESSWQYCKVWVCSCLCVVLTSR